MSAWPNQCIKIYMNILILIYVDNIYNTILINTYKNVNLLSCFSSFIKM